MRLFYEALTILVIGILAIGFVKSMKKKNDLSFSVSFLLGSIIFSLINGFFAYNTLDVDLAYMTHGLYYAGIAWMMMGTIRFVVDYERTIRMVKPLANTMLAVTIIDTVNLGLNTVYHHAFSLQRYAYRPGWGYYDLNGYSWSFSAHVIYVYVLVAIAIIVLTMGISSKSRMYRRTRWLFFGIFCAAVFVDTIFYTSRYPLKISSICYGILGIMAYYYSMEFTHHDVVNKSLLHLLENSDSGIALFDIHNRLIYMNDLAKEAYDVENQEQFALKNKEWCKKLVEDNKNYEEYIENRIVNGRRQFIEKRIFILQDDYGYPLGNSLVSLDRTKEYERLDQEHYMLTHDALTGLYTMERFGEATKEMLDANPDIEFCMICSNIKEFKLINDLFGRQKGDEVLQTQAFIMKNSVAEPGTYGRIGADMFAICMPKERFQEEIFIKNIRDMENAYTSSVYRMHVSIGVYNIRNREEAISVMCDRCMMAIQAMGRDYTSFVTYCDDSLIEKAADANRLLGEFESALAERQFHMFLQPQVDMEGKMVGAEALVRWFHPEEGLITPDRFIPVLEDAALIQKLDLYVWEEAAKTLKRWKALGHEELYVSINISVKDFYYLDVYKVLTELVEKYEINPRKLNLEITESVLLSNPKERIELFDRLQAFGFRMELDDFGSGFSSLNMLKDIHVNGLKIDRSFLDAATTDERGNSVLKNIFLLAKDLNMSVVTEGVETEEQVKMVQGFGGEYMQGFYFSKPISVKDFELKYRLL